MGRVKGVNIKSDKGVIKFGVHKAQYIAELDKMTPNEAGYLNFEIVPNTTPTTGGYSHKMFLADETFRNNAGGQTSSV